MSQTNGPPPGYPNPVADFDPTALRDELRHLPVLGIVSFALRCALRIPPPNADNILGLAARLARGEELPNEDFSELVSSANSPTTEAMAAVSRVAEAAVFAVAGAEPADAAAQAAVETVAAVLRAADVVDGAVLTATVKQAMSRDFQTLRGFRPETAPDTPLVPVDPSDSGPLGPLWQGGEPACLRERRAAARSPAPVPASDLAREACALEAAYPPPDTAAVLADFRWIREHWETDTLRPYRGRYIAVRDKEVVLAGGNVLAVRVEAAKKFATHPGRFAVVYVDRWESTPT